MFCLSVRKVIFEHPDCFDLRYVYHRYKHTADGKYWWHSRDDSRQLFRMENGYMVSPYYP